MISEVFNMDCMVGMKSYPDKYFDLAVVDPPYGIGCAKTINIKNDKRGFSGKKLHKTKGWDDSIPQAEYFNEVKRISVNQIFWGGNYFTDFLIPTKAWVIWDKKDTTTQGSNFSDAELAWTSFERVTKIFKYGWIGIDYCNKAETKIHPTQKPIALYSWIYKNYLPNGGKVIDTHLGSGSNRIAADKAGNIDFTGYELDKDYFEAQEKRFRDYKSQLVLDLK